MSGVTPGISFINAANDRARSVRVAADRIVGVDVRPARGDCVVDLAGDRLLPGLINAHDHLQFSNFPRTRYRLAHQNVREWIDDVSSRRGRDPALAAADALSLEARLYAGGLKSLLSGVTTVAHHDAYVATFDARGFPGTRAQPFRLGAFARAAQRTEVAASHRATSPSWPWIIHAGEGVDADASQRVRAPRCAGLPRLPQSARACAGLRCHAAGAAGRARRWRSSGVPHPTCSCSAARSIRDRCSPPVAWRWAAIRASAERAICSMSCATRGVSQAWAKTCSRRWSLATTRGCCASKIAAA